MSKKKIVFVSSAGGHLAQILELKPLFDKYDYCLITEDVPSAVDATTGMENVLYIKRAIRKNNALYILSFIKYIYLALKVMFIFKPDVIISTGTHQAVAFCYVGKIFKKKIIFFLTYARVKSRAISADLVYPISDLFIVQWQSALQNYPKA